MSAACSSPTTWAWWPRHATDRLVVMYAGRVVEQATTEALFAAPRHHYTAGLLRSIPSYTAVGLDRADAPRTRLAEIPGMVPPLHALPPGCTFADRCPAAIDRCRTEAPALVELAPRHRVRCHLPREAA
jgi:oligopeptide/dipeptide ABC transporter ATP-binding protein